MSDDKSQDDVPMGQKLLNSPFILLVAGLVVMFVFYTIWGAVEIWTLPQATLP
jgi:hypothetical protein